MIVFNLYAVLVAGVAFVVALLWMALGGSPTTGFGVGVMAADLTLRLRADLDVDWPLLSPRSGGALFWILPTWVLAIPFTFLAVIASCGDGDDEEQEYVPPVRHVQEVNVRRAVSEPLPTSTLKVVTVPPGARVTANLVQEGQTPLTVVVSPGTDVEVTVQMQGYLTVYRKVRVGADPVELALELEAGRPVQVSSTPAGAEVRLEAQRLGRTPMEVVVPTKRKAVLTVELPGFAARTFKVGGRGQSSTIRARLKPLPLERMPLTEDERAELQSLQAQISETRRELQQAKRVHDRAKAEFQRITTQSRFGPGARIEAEDALVEAKSMVETLQVDFDDYNSQVESLRGAVRARMLGDGG